MGWKFWRILVEDVVGRGLVRMLWLRGMGIGKMLFWVEGGGVVVVEG